MIYHGSYELQIMVVQYARKKASFAGGGRLDEQWRRKIEK